MAIEFELRYFPRAGRKLRLVSHNSIVFHSLTGRYEVRRGEEVTWAGSLEEAAALLGSATVTLGRVGTGLAVIKARATGWYHPRAVRDFPSLRLSLVRHAQARHAPGISYEDASLSTLGRMQAAAVAHACTDPPPAALYSSPAPRARQTADVIGVATGLSVTVDERLLEYRSGTITDPGLTVEQILERRGDLLAWHPNSKLAPDGETIREFAARVEAVTDEITARHVSERVVIVSHAGAIHMIMRWASGLGPGAPVLHGFLITNASISELIHWPGGRITGGAPRHTEFASVGSVDHVPPEHRSGN